MAGTQNQKKLIIPGKTDPTAPLYYARDMRTIEMWANALQTGGGGITEITTGTPGVLTITDPTGPTVNIDSTGGGGGGGVGLWELTAGPDTRAVNAADPFGLSFSGMAMPASGTQLTSEWLTINEPTVGGTHRQYTFTCSWLFSVGAGWSVSFLPLLEAPAFTGGITVQFTIEALALDQSDGAIWQTNPITFTTGESYQSQDTDFVNNPGPPFGDLSLQPFGTAFEGNGIVSAAGNTYFGSAQANVTVAPGTTFP